MSLQKVSCHRMVYSPKEKTARPMLFLCSIHTVEMFAASGDFLLRTSGAAHSDTIAISGRSSIKDGSFQ